MTEHHRLVMAAFVNAHRAKTKEAREMWFNRWKELIAEVEEQDEPATVTILSPRES